VVVHACNPSYLGGSIAIRGQPKQKHKALSENKL
jgi:hypothetical protein